MINNTVNNDNGNRSGIDTQILIVRDLTGASERVFFKVCHTHLDQQQKIYTDGTEAAERKCIADTQ